LEQFLYGRFLGKTGHISIHSSLSQFADNSQFDETHHNKSSEAHISAFQANVFLSFINSPCVLKSIDYLWVLRNQGSDTLCCTTRIVATVPMPASLTYSFGVYALWLVRDEK